MLEIALKMCLIISGSIKNDDWEYLSKIVIKPNLPSRLKKNN